MLDLENDHELKEKLLQSLIDKMEDIMGEGMAPKKSVAVEVAAPDKEHLADGLDKAKEVLAHAPVDEMAAKTGEGEEDGRSDAERLAELMGDSDDEDEEDELKR